MFDLCESDGCAFGPYGGNHRKKIWTYRGEMTEEWVNANGVSMSYSQYDTWEDLAEDYDVDEFEETPHWWRDRTGYDYFFCDGCHAALMGRQIPTIVEDDFDLDLLLVA